MPKTISTSETACPFPGCKVAYWEEIVRTRRWIGFATSQKDAELTLAGARLVHESFHEGPLLKRKLTRLDSAREVVAKRLALLQGCALDDDRDLKKIIAAMAEAAVEFADLDLDKRSKP